MPIFLFKRSISPDIMVMIPSPPACIKSNITICPNTLQVDTVGRVTSPVTQVEVVAVKSASRYGTASPLAELIGNAKNTLPTRIVARKLSNMICVVVSTNFFFLTIRIFLLKAQRNQRSLQSAGSSFIYCVYYITLSRFCQYFLHERIGSTNSGFSVSLLYHNSRVFATVKGVLRELLSLSFIHFFHKPPYRFLVPFGLRLHCESLILLCGASVNAWCYALCSHSASHRGAICAHSLTSELAASHRLIISEYFDTRYLRSCRMAKR